MLNEERVKLMVKMAMYESKFGDEEFKISSYYKRDYTSLHTIATIIWSTIGYAIAVILLGLVFMDKLLNHATLRTFITVGGVTIVLYILVLILCGIAANQFYQRKYNKAKHRVKQYYRELVELNKIYKKEKL
ncbi:MAG: hypothetical protein RRY06_03960 [Lachnospiraceae bacterium]